MRQVRVIVSQTRWVEMELLLEKDLEEEEEAEALEGPQRRHLPTHPLTRQG